MIIFQVCSRFQSYQLEMSEVELYQCIVAADPYCLMHSVPGQDCNSTDSDCNRLKSYVGPEWDAKKIFFIWSYLYISNADSKWSPNLWNSFCWIASFGKSSLKMIVNKKIVGEVSIKRSFFRSETMTYIFKFQYFFGKVIGDELSLVFTLAPTQPTNQPTTTTLQSYPGLYLSPGVRYLRSVKGKNYSYDVGNPLRFFFFLHPLIFFQPFI